MASDQWSVRAESSVPARLRSGEDDRQSGPGQVSVLGTESDLRVQTRGIQICDGPVHSAPLLPLGDGGPGPEEEGQDGEVPCLSPAASSTNVSPASPCQEERNTCKETEAVQTSGTEAR